MRLVLPDAVVHVVAEGEEREGETEGGLHGAALRGVRDDVTQLVLSTFPGIDVLGMGFEDAGFCVVKTGDPMFGQRGVEEFHPPPGKFDGVIGGPPCKGDSLLAHLNGDRSITYFEEFCRILDEVRPIWWLMEAVRPHPELDLGHILKLSPRWLGEKQSRVRYFHSNIDLEQYVRVSLFENHVYNRAVLAGHGGAYGSTYRGMTKYTLEQAAILQGLPADFDIPAFKVRYKQEVVGNAVPLRVAAEMANAVKLATNTPPTPAS